MVLTDTQCLAASVVQKIFFAPLSTLRLCGKGNVSVLLSASQPLWFKRKELFSVHS